MNLHAFEELGKGSFFQRGKDNLYFISALSLSYLFVTVTVVFIALEREYCRLHIKITCKLKEVLAGIFCHTSPVSRSVFPFTPRCHPFN